MASNSTLLLKGSLTQSRVNGTEHILPLLRGVTDVSEVSIRDWVAQGSVSALPVPLGVQGSACAVIISTDRPIVVHVNAANSAGIECGSLFVVMDTSVTGLWVDNVGTDPASFEVWAVQRI